MVKKAVVLAGGGTDGALFEIGALQALDALLPAEPLHTWEVIVGTSAGALVGTLLAHSTRAAAMPGLWAQRKELLRSLPPRRVALDWDLWRRLVYQRRARHRMRSGVRECAGRKGARLDLPTRLWALGDCLSPGVFSTRPLGDALHGLLRDQGHSDRFALAPRALYVVATQVSSGKRQLFGPMGTLGDTAEDGGMIDAAVKGGMIDAAVKGGMINIADAPISLAVAASCAVPLVYAPVRINGRAYVDGGLHGPAALDVAIGAGAKLIVCINPLAPLYDAQEGAREWGALTVLYQAARTVMQATLHRQVDALRRRYPDVRIVLIEPQGVQPAAMPWGPLRLGEDWAQTVDLAREQTARALLAHYDGLAARLQEAGLHPARDWLEALAAETV